MFFYVDNNNRMTGYDEALLEPERKHVECDHFAPNGLIYPAWDVVNGDWVESVTSDELSAMNKEQIPTQPDVTKDINTKLDKILNLLKSK